MYASWRKAKACSSGRRSAWRSRRAGANAKANRAGMSGSPCSPPSAWVMRCACEPAARTYTDSRAYHRRTNGRSLRHFAQCGQHGLPANSVISCRDVNRQHREVRIGLSVGLQGVEERLRSCPCRECILVWVAGCIKLPRELLRQGASDKSPQQIASGDRCGHFGTGKEGCNVTKHKRGLLIIKHDAEYFGRKSAGPWCGAFAGAAEVSRAARSSATGASG